MKGWGLRGVEGLFPNQENYTSLLYVTFCFPHLVTDENRL